MKREIHLTMKYWLIIASVLFVLASCTVSSGLNKPCSLPKKIDGGTVVPITEQEVQENTGSNDTSTRDFVAFGAVDCEDLVCVRDPDAADRARGICRSCRPFRKLTSRFPERSGGIENSAG